MFCQMQSFDHSRASSRESNAVSGVTVTSGQFMEENFSKFGPIASRKTRSTIGPSSEAAGEKGSSGSQTAARARGQARPKQEDPKPSLHHPAGAVDFLTSPPDDYDE
jgi:hypothetical protein